MRTYAYRRSELPVSGYATTCLAGLVGGRSPCYAKDNEEKQEIFGRNSVSPKQYPGDPAPGYVRCVRAIGAIVAMLFLGLTATQSLSEDESVLAGPPIQLRQFDDVRAVEFGLPLGLHATVGAGSKTWELPLTENNPMIIDLKRPAVKRKYDDFKRRMPIMFTADLSSAYLARGSEEFIYNEANCKQMEEMFGAIGVRGAREITPINMWHFLGQQAGAYAAKHNYTPAMAVEALAPTPDMWAMPLVGRGPLHGVVWYTAGAAKLPAFAEFWQTVQREWCAFDGKNVNLFWDCLHGVGHGVLINHAFSSSKSGESWAHNPCITFGTIARPNTVHLEAQKFCAGAPSRDVAYACSAGMWHGFFEHHIVLNSTGGVSKVDWTDPCKEADAPALCFFFFFYTGLIYDEWRLDQMKARAGHVTQACLTTSLPSEKHVRGCIFGASGILYPYYDTATGQPPARGGTSLNETDCWSPPFDANFKDESAEMWGKRLSMFSPLKLPMHTSYTCGLLFKKNQPPVEYQTPHTLVDWCSKFVSDSPARVLDDVERLRWLACVGGAVHWSLEIFVTVHDVPETLVTQYCNQLLHVDWQLNATQRLEAKNLCLHAALYRRKPKARWDDLNFYFTHVLDQP